MAHESALGQVSRLGSSSLGIFRGTDAVEAGVSRNQLTALVRAGALTREFPDTYRLSAVPRSPDQRLRSALLWAGPSAAAAGRSAGAVYGLEGVKARTPEIVVPRSHRGRSTGVLIHRSDDRAALMVRRYRSLPVTGIESTLVAFGALLEDEPFEIAGEDARRRGFTSVAALRAHLDRYGRAGRPGVGALRALLHAVDPVHPSRSTLEVKTRRLLTAHGLNDFVREYPMAWNGRAYHFDFAFVRERTILETNGRRWHDDPVDFEHDNEKWSVPGRHGYRLVLATWAKVTRCPDAFVHEVRATLAG
jgi:hypothetical protein